MQRDEGKSTDPAQATQNAANEAIQLEQLRDDCAKLPREDINNWQNWLEKSAAAGDSEARGSFAHSVLNEFKDPQYKEENYDEYKRQNDLATQYLNDSVAGGDCSSAILNGYRWVKLDSPSTTYVYQSLLLKYWLNQFVAGSLANSPTADREISSLTATLKNLAYDVPPDEFASADNAANYILQNVCQTNPGDH